VRIRLARQEGKTVCPIKGPGLEDLGKLPPLIRVLQDESRRSASLGEVGLL
jgi:hypothetical protein